MRFVLCLFMLFVSLSAMGVHITAPYPDQSENEYQAATKSDVKIAQFDTVVSSTLASGSTFAIGVLPANAIYMGAVIVPANFIQTATGCNEQVLLRSQVLLLVRLRHLLNTF